MATAAASSSAAQRQLVLKISPPNSPTRLRNGGPKSNTLLLLSTISFKKRPFLVRAAEPDGQEQNSDHSALLSQEDLNYLMKLGVGSVAGAAAIKYGSVVFPEITTPNIVEALSIISFPVVAAVLLLIAKSRSVQ